MQIDCTEWSDCGIRGGGCCGQQRYGGAPSLGVCGICEHRVSRDGKGIQRIIRAIPKVLTALTVSGDTVQANERLAICKTCHHYDGTRCLKCGCFMAFKSRLANEHCPVGKW
jgi:hypothetical protein